MMIQTACVVLNTKDIQADWKTVLKTGNVWKK